VQDAKAGELHPFIPSGFAVSTAAFSNVRSVRLPTSRPAFAALR